uniref:Uncharacterized protein n=1 Tax=Rousettus aegyptiacus TaxID=9407 RepID=A0A7J8ILK1_ROUAE|nr:hypothetical protein HJG63_010672 [Rousettus aegyptiacus]
MFFYSISLKNVTGILIGIALNLYNALGNMVILTMLILLIQEYGISFHFFVSSSISFNRVLQFSLYRSFICFVKFIPRYFILFVVIMAGIFVCFIRCSNFSTWNQVWHRVYTQQIYLLIWMNEASVCTEVKEAEGENRRGKS